MTNQPTPIGGRKQPAVGYVRVSRVAGRAGESFISPDVQREAISAVAAAKGLNIVEWHTDLDQSGGKYDRPGFQAALDACERGDAGALVVARLTRFARGVLDTHRAIGRLDACGARLVAADMDVDTTTATGRLIRGILSELAAFELELANEQWDTAKANAVERGVYIAPRAPFGFGFDDAHRLTPNADARVVVALFEARAAGASWSTLAAQFNEASGKRVSKQTIGHMIRNRAYVGCVAYGDLRNERAHPAIVDHDLFDRAQAPSNAWRAGRPSIGGGEGMAKALLAGLAKCEACGTGMARSSSANRRAGYRCPNRGVNGTCSAPASIAADDLDAYVVDAVLAWAGAVADERVLVELGDPTAHRDARDALAAAERALEVFVTAPDGFGLPADVFAAGVAARSAAVDDARDVLEMLGEETAYDVARTTLREAWPMLDTTERRRLLAVVVDRVDVRRGVRPGAPVYSRATVRMLDGSTLAVAVDKHAA